jgi:hypothetical protein
MITFAVGFTALAANGTTGTSTTTFLTLTFDRDTRGLEISDITFGAGSTGAQAVSFTSLGDGVYRLYVRNVASGGSVTVGVSKTGYNFSPSSQTTTIYLGPQQTFGVTVVFSDSKARTIEIERVIQRDFSKSDGGNAAFTVTDTFGFIRFVWIAAGKKVAEGDRILLEASMRIDGQDIFMPGLNWITVLAYENDTLYWSGECPIYANK